MQVNADFSQRVVIRAEQRAWSKSPQQGVQRTMLDRIGIEQARATSLVQYERGSSFPRHTHPLGEEILVLDGVFSDESGDYPRGWYLRNPPDSSHHPSSVDGALIFVKLMQMQTSETALVRIDTSDPSRWHTQGEQTVCTLFYNEQEQTRLLRLPALYTWQGSYPNGAEMLVLNGKIQDDAGAYDVGTWLRLPAGTQQRWTSGTDGATVYMKTGHLQNASMDRKTS